MFETCKLSKISKLCKMGKTCSLDESASKTSKMIQICKIIRKSKTSIMSNIRLNLILVLEYYSNPVVMAGFLKPFLSLPTLT
jgi:hypothetical protein